MAQMIAANEAVVLEEAAVLGISDEWTRSDMRRPGFGELRKFGVDQEHPKWLYLRDHEELLRRLVTERAAKIENVTERDT